MRKYLLGIVGVLALSTSIANASSADDLSANEYLAGAEACYRLRVLQHSIEERLERTIKFNKSRGTVISGSDYEALVDEEENAIQQIPIYDLVVKAAGKVGLSAETCRKMDGAKIYLNLLGSPDPGW